MTVRELKESIKDLPDDMEVILQKDSEGNGYSPLIGADVNCIYYPDNAYSGEIWDSEDEEKPEGGSKVIVLYPTN